MSSGKAFGYILAGTCSVATAYYTLAPELQRQQREREAAFQAQHPATISPEQVRVESASTEARSSIQSENMPTTESPKEQIKDKVQTSWPGLSWFQTSYGGGSTSNEQNNKKD
ncbi:Hypothetical protein D9617_9g025410 [Elsinoe fawcettii]|nr:Hypothetical protein D9617_9g025410 [Elsinoe fawcettii]